MQARGFSGEGAQVKTRPDAFDVVKRFLEDLKDGRVAASRVSEIRTEVFAVVARMEKVKKMFPAAGDLGFGDGMELLLKMLPRGRGLLDQAALF